MHRWGFLTLEGMRIPIGTVLYLLHCGAIGLHEKGWIDQGILIQKSSYRLYVSL